MNELLTSGVELMLIGMGIVFGFLAMLVFVISIVSGVVRRYFPDMPDRFLAHRPEDDPGVVAAITAAVQQYRRKHSRS